MDLTRGVPPAMMTALAGVFHPVVLVYLDWPGAPVRAHTGAGVISWGGYDWQGVGPFGGISVPAEIGGSMVATEAELLLLADPSTLADYADDAIRNRDAEILFGCTTGRPRDTGGTTLVSDPVSIFRGMMDALMFEVRREGDNVAHQAAVTLITGQSARAPAAVYHSNEDQSRKYPGDTAGRHLVLAMARAQKFTWPES